MDRATSTATSPATSSAREPLNRMRNPLGSGPKRTREPASAYHQTSAPTSGAPGSKHHATVDLEHRRQQLSARVAELQWDLGGLVYEMAIRDNILMLVKKRAAAPRGGRQLQRGRADPADGTDRHLRVLHGVRRAAQQWRCVLLAVRPSVARAGLGRLDPRVLGSRLRKSPTRRRRDTRAATDSARD